MWGDQTQKIRIKYPVSQQLHKTAKAVHKTQRGHVDTERQSFEKSSLIAQHLVSLIHSHTQTHALVETMHEYA